MLKLAISFSSLVVHVTQRLLPFPQAHGSEHELASPPGASGSHSS